MGEYILKASPDHEWYAAWSTYTGCIIYTFPTREEVLEYISEPSHLADGSIMTQPLLGIFTPEARLARADEYGSSSLHRWYGWDNKYMLFNHDIPERVKGSVWFLPRARLLDYCKLRHMGADEEALELFELFEDNDTTAYVEDDSSED